MDDCLFAVHTTERAIEASLQVIQLLKKGNFHLKKFVSNGKEILASIPAEERTVNNLDLDMLSIEKALLLQWNTESDSFGVKESMLQKQLNGDITQGDDVCQQ